VKSIVITGGTRGIGFGLVREFLRLGHSVTFCGRTQAGVAAAEAQLVTHYGAERVRGVVCDVTRLEQVRALWDAAVANFGRVDLWINNAGLNAPRMPVWELDEATLRDVLEVNVLGVMYGSKVALSGMIVQGSGQLYNMEGLGSDGMVLAGSALYGSSKAALSYLTRGLVLDTKGLPVQVGFLSPGIVLTDLFTGGVEPDARTRRVANILGDRVETVAPFLVRRMLADRRHGSRIAWLTRPKIFRRFLTARFQKRDLFTP
jgi:NAD(P)-dependent dehydrogenase (short-subunit alcohol dehydrogenase family)